MKNRIVFLDYLRVVAIFMVMLVHCCECYYFNDNMEFSIASLADAHWLTVIDSMCRASVPLFVMASAFLLFPVVKPTGEFLKRRILRVFIPFAIWACLYNAFNHGRWTEMLFNFPAATGGHLWFVPMIIGLYLLMPLLSPWAEKVGKRELGGWLAVWLFTTLFPYLRPLWGHLFGAPSFGAVPYLYGECPWNPFGTFHYVSGFIGYMLLAFAFRKFIPELSVRRTLAIALPLIAIGWFIAWSGFYFRIPSEAGWPVTKPYAMAVDLEASWMFCSTGVALTVIGFFLLLRLCRGEGPFYRNVIRPLSEASFGIYLVHIFALVPIMGHLKDALPTGVALPAGALCTFAAAAVASIALRKIPRLGKWICG